MLDIVPSAAADILLLLLSIADCFSSESSAASPSTSMSSSSSISAGAASVDRASNDPPIGEEIREGWRLLFADLL